MTFALSIAAEAFSHSYRFSHITSNDGLTQSEVYSFLKDSQGYMWFGTVHGLNSFDGYELNTFMADNTDSESLVNNTVRYLAEDDYGRIWVATDFGLDYYEKSTRKFIHVDLESRIEPLCVSSLAYRDSMMYVGTNVDFYIVDMRKGPETMDIHACNITSLNGGYRTNEIIIDGGAFYLCTVNGITAVSIDDDYNVTYLDLPRDVKFLSCESALKLEDGKILFGGNNRLVLYDTSTGTVTNTDCYLGEVSSIVKDKDGYVWVGTNFCGLFRMKVEGTEISVIENIRKNPYELDGLSSDLITSLYVSDENILWIGTIGSGIDYLKPGKASFNYINIPPVYHNIVPSTTFVRSVYSDSGDKVYIGLHSNGLLEYDRSKNTYDYIGLDNKPVFHISDFINGSLLLCSGGLYELTPKGKIVKIQGGDDACFCAVEGENGIYWIASYSGLYMLDTKQGGSLKVEKCNALNYHTQHYNNCRVLKYDKDRSVLWVGTEGGGLFMISIDDSGLPTGIRQFNSTDANMPLSNSFVRSLYIDRQGRLWVGTYDGLNIVDYGGEQVAIEKNCFRASLPNNVIQGIEGDLSGNVWVSTNAGLVRIPPEGAPVTYTVQDGLQNNEFSEHVTFCNDKGELFFGGINGVSYFRPEDIVEKGEFRKVIITEFLVKDWKSRQTTEYFDYEGSGMETSLELKPKQKEIRVKFSAMEYETPSKIMYRYRLQGYDSEWNYTDSENRVIQYTNLSPGRYTLKISASNSSGEWNQDSTDLHFHIQTPMLLRIPFLLVYFILFVCVVYAVIRYSVRKTTHRKKVELENEHNKRLHQLDLLRTKFFVNISHDLRTPLTLIIGPLEQMIKGGNTVEYMQAKARQAYKSANKLKFMVEQLLDFRKVEVGKEKLQMNKIELNKWLSEEISYFSGTIEEKGLELRMNLQLKPQDILIDTRKVSKILFNLMSNAIKFTASGYILVSYRLEEKDSKVFISVEDSGKGIDARNIDRIFERFFTESDLEGLDGYGIGLSYCKDLALAMNGDLTVSSEYGKGTVFTLSLPLITDAANTCPNAPQSHSISLAVDSAVESSFVMEYDKDKKTVLVVDDNQEMRYYIAELLQDQYNVNLASSADEALSIAEESVVDMILCDVMMPGMNGIEFTHAIKSNVSVSHIPVILITAKTEIETMLSGFKNGADDYISKPFDSQVLLAKIQSVLENRERIRRIFQKDTAFDLSGMSMPDPDADFLKKVMNFMETNIENPEYSVDYLEKDMCMSHSKFFRKLKALTGMSGKELMQDLRLKRAAQLLTQTNLTISEVAFKSGFIDSKYFSFAFKQKFEVAPTKYRENKGSEKA